MDTSTGTSASTARGTSTGVAPSEPCESSAVLLGFVNTTPHGSGPVELLGDSESLAAWLTGAGLMAADTAVTRADVVAAHELRAALCTVFLSRSGCEGSADRLPEAEQYLARIAERYPLTLRVTAQGCRPVPAQTGVLGAFAGLLAAAADLAARGAWLRMKICKNPTCYSGFYDRTRNTSGLYCGTACGSQAAQRAYRNRIKDASCAQAS
ncbi:CGNR zinc finger domain-containing protein [Streptomyces sp. NBC_00341]|uniref:ABATE domain-containing protein n=1 Tax=Streptomyces sp. NBC_00341 TaxID=2975717 RepID=UPI003084B76A|nr:CGNR zinc finger domain-containing protein [Streptomyces sp. NBC_00341]